MNSFSRSARLAFLLAFPLVACATGVVDGDNGSPAADPGADAASAVPDVDASSPQRDPGPVAHDSGAPSPGADSAPPVADAGPPPVADSGPPPVVDAGPPPVVDSGPPPAVDSGPTATCAQPNTPAPCTACQSSGHTCQPNGCYNQYLCVLATAKCVAPSSTSCP